MVHVIPKLLAVAPQGTVKTSQGSCRFLAKKQPPYTMAKLPVEKVWELLDYGFLKGHRKRSLTGHTQVKKQ